MPTAKVTSKGQITLPKEVREKLGLVPGDELEFVEVEGQFVLRRRMRRSPFERYRGYLRKLKGQNPDEIVKELRGHDAQDTDHRSPYASLPHPLDPPSVGRRSRSRSARNASTTRGSNCRPALR